MTRRITPQRIASKLGVKYEELSEFQKNILQNECQKQQWIKVLRTQGFVKARWRGVEIKPKEIIEDEPR